VKRGSPKRKNQSKHTSRLYIAYGSNLNIEQMNRRCPDAKIIGISEVKDYQLMFRGSRLHAVATIEPAKGKSVPVLIWDLSKQDEAFLDIYEGWPNFYRKETMPVEMNGKQADAMIYLMNDGYSMGIPSLMYLNTILDGYESAGFDKAVLEEAVLLSIGHKPLDEAQEQQSKQALSEYPPENSMNMEWL